MFKFSLEARVQASRSAMLLMPVLAVFLTLIVSSGMFIFLNKPPLSALYSLLIEPLTTSYGVGEVLKKASPLLIIAQALAIGFRATGDAPEPVPPVIFKVGDFKVQITQDVESWCGIFCKLMGLPPLRWPKWPRITWPKWGKKKTLGCPGV